MDKDLEAKIAERKKDAEDRNIAGKAREIALKLGDHTETGEGLDCFGKAYKIGIFHNQKFEICSKSNWTSDIQDGGYKLDIIWIKYHMSNIPEDVFVQNNGEIVMYCPNSEWLREFESLYNHLFIETEKAAREKESKEEEADLRKRFGL